jgi:hypothetical protein
VLSEIERLSVVLTERFDADPHDLSGCHHDVQIAGVVSVEPRRQYLRFENRCG